MKQQYIIYLFLLSTVLLIHSTLTGTNSCPVLDRHVIKPSTNCNSALCHTSIHVFVDSLTGKITVLNPDDTTNTHTTTGIEDVNYLNGVTVSPTITTRNLTIANANHNTMIEYTVYALTGQRVMNGIISNFEPTVTIDMGELIPSLYLLTIREGIRSATFKVVKQ